MNFIFAGLLRQIYASKVQREKQDEEVFAPQSFCRACDSKRALLGEGGAQRKEEVVTGLPALFGACHSTGTLSSKLKHASVSRGCASSMQDRIILGEQGTSPWYYWSYKAQATLILSMLLARVDHR